MPLRATVDGREIDGDLVPLANHVLVRPREAETVSKGGILLSNKGKEKPTEGVVLSVGPGGVDEETGKKLPMWVEAGSKVLYGKYGCEKIQYNDEEHMLVKDSDVLLMYSGEEPTLENIKIPYGKVLMELKEKPTESEGGLILSLGSAKPDTKVGKVVAAADGMLGSDGEVLPLELAVGDTVRFLYGREVKLELGASEYRVVDAGDCLAKWAE
uniref:20 kDa chaperonin, chloroplastic n=1 Tax=Alexandrium catenella TaxID=2925 RepID=A0A7S1LKI4_ALECA